MERTVVLHIESLHGPAAASVCKKELRKTAGVKEVSVNPFTRNVVVSGRFEDPEKLVDAVYSAGFFDAVLLESQRYEDALPRNLKKQRTKVFISLALAAVAAYLNLGFPLPAMISPQTSPLLFSGILLAVSVACIALCYQPLLDGVKSIIGGVLGSEALGLIAVFCSAVISVIAFIRLFLFQEEAVNELFLAVAAAVPAVLMWVRYLENQAIWKLNRQESRWEGIIPSTCYQLNLFEIEEIPVRSLKEGMVLVVNPGKRIAADGIIISGEAVVDGSVLTGEPPVRKKEGDCVLAGMLCQDGVLRVRVTKTGEDTILAQMRRYCFVARERQGEASCKGEKAARVVSTIAVVAAALAFGALLILGKEFNQAFAAALGVLCAACPGAVAFSASYGALTAMQGLAKSGVLCRSVREIEKIARCRTLVFPQLGVVSQGRPELVSVGAIDEIAQDRVLAIAASCIEGIDHPAARAVADRAQQEELETEMPNDRVVVAGAGVIAKFHEYVALVGSAKLLKSLKVEVPLQETADSDRIYVTHNNRCVGYLDFQDPQKVDAKSTMQDLSKRGVQTILLTGAAGTRAQALAADYCVSSVYPGLNEKEESDTAAAIAHEAKRPVSVAAPHNRQELLETGDISIDVPVESLLVSSQSGVCLMRRDASCFSRLFDSAQKERKRHRRYFIGWVIYHVLALPAAALVTLLWNGSAGIPVIWPVISGVVASMPAGMFLLGRGIDERRGDML